MQRSLPVFFDEVPDFDPRDGFMVVRWGGYELAMPIPICERSHLMCGEALAKWRLSRLDTGDVVPLR